MVLFPALGMAEEKEQEKERGQGQKWVGYRPSATKKASRLIAIGRSEAVLELHHAPSVSRLPAF